MSNLRTKLSLSLLVSGSLACSGEGGSLKGKPGHAQAAAQESVPELGRDQESKPAEGRLGEAANSSPKAPADAENSVTPPQAISGTYLTCPIIDETESTLDIGCKYADTVTHIKIPDATYFKSVTPQVSFANEEVQVKVRKLPLAAAWSQLINLKFKTKEQKARLLPSLMVQVNAIGHDDKVRNERVVASAKPVEVTSGLGIRNLRNADHTFIGFYGASDPNVLSEQAIGSFMVLKGVFTNWKLDTDGKIKNPLGYCMAAPTAISPTSQSVDCGDVMASTYVKQRNHLQITNGPRAGECLTVNSIPQGFFVGDNGPRYLVGLTRCVEADYNQHWDFVFY